MTKLITLFSLCIFLPVSLLAQGQQARVRSFITLLAWDQSAEGLNPRLWSGETKLKEYERLDSLRRSEPLKYEGNGRLTVTLEDQLPVSGTAEYEASNVAINPSWDRTLIIITRSPESPSGFKLVAIDDSVSGFGWGDYRFINNTKSAFNLRLNDKMLQLKQGSKPSTYRPRWELGNIPIVMLVQNRKRPVYSSIWEHNPNVRSLIIIDKSSDVRLGVVSVKVVPERKVLAPPVENQVGTP